MEILTTGDNFTVKTSSTLNRDSKQFGKRFMFDGNPDTCWNSDQGSPQYVVIEFTCPVRVKQVTVRFQGGFVGRECLLQGSGCGQDKPIDLQKVYPKDSNSSQSFPINDDSSVLFFTTYKLTFTSSSDLFGRITIYNLELLGEKLDPK